MEEKQRPKTAESSPTSSKCPAALVHDEKATATATTRGLQSLWSFLSASPTKTTMTTTTTTVKVHSECPAKKTIIPASIEEAAQHPQEPHPDQRIPLDTHRVVSSIPKKNSSDSDDQEQQPQQRWVYPSEQQFYNAMRRKGYVADPESMSAVVRIHNTVNEKTWTHVCQWEKELHGVECPRLVKFLGRPNDRSPKAWWNVITGNNPPFDRHDWYVDRGDGKERRYVIDFYEGSKSSSSTPNNNNDIPSMYLDVRPALDDSQAVLDRIRMTARDVLPGIFSSSNNVTNNNNNTQKRTK